MQPEADQEPKTFAERFKRLKKKAGKGYLALAAELTAHGQEILKIKDFQISGAALHKWAQGKSAPTPENLAIVAEYFKVSRVWLFFGDEFDLPTEDARNVARCWQILPEGLRASLKNEVFLLAESFKPHVMTAGQQVFYRRVSEEIKRLKRIKPKKKTEEAILRIQEIRKNYSMG